MVRILAYFTCVIMLIAPALLLPDLYKLESKSIALTGEKPIILGRKELHSPTMVNPHIAISADNQGLLLADLAPGRRILIHKDGTYIDSSGLMLGSTPVKVKIGDQLLTIGINQEGHIKIRTNYGNSVFTREGLTVNGTPVYSSCRNPPIGQHLSDWWARLKGNTVGFDRLTLGGAYTCISQLALDSKISAYIANTPQGWVLSSREPEAVFVQHSGERHWNRLADFVLPVDDSGIFIAGNTTYKAKEKDNNLIISTVNNAPLSLKNDSDNNGESWSPVINDSWQIKSKTSLLVSAALSIILLGATVRLSRQKNPFVLISSFICYSLVLFNYINIVTIPFIAYISLLSFVVIVCINSNWQYIFLTLFIAGSQNQLLLALNSNTQLFYDKFNQQLLIVATFCFVITLFRSFKINTVEVILNLIKKQQIFITFLLSFLILIIIQISLGTETGISGFINPAELIKAIMGITVSALLANLITFNDTLLKQSIINAILATIILTVLSLLFLMSINDHSPVLILAAMLMVMLIYLSQIMISRTANWSRKSVYVGILILLIMILSITKLTDNELTNVVASKFSSIFPAFFRLKTFLIEESIIDAFQTNQALQSISEASLFPRDWGNKLTVPAVENDFSFTHMLYKQGKIIAFSIILCVMIFIFFIIIKSFYLVHKAIYSKGLLTKRLQVVNLAIFTGMINTALLIHILINISSNIGLLPVIGQPLALVSFANSHILLFLSVALISAHYLLKLNGENYEFI